MKALLARIFLDPVAWLGRIAGRVSEAIKRAHRVRSALKPGTRLEIQCGCHAAGTIWYVVSYDPDADDYKITLTWPFVPSVGNWEYQRLNDLVRVLGPAESSKESS